MFIYKNLHKMDPYVGSFCFLLVVVSRISGLDLSYPIG